MNLGFRRQGSWPQSPQHRTCSVLEAVLRDLFVRSRQPEGRPSQLSHGWRGEASTVTKAIAQRVGTLKDSVGVQADVLREGTCSLKSRLQHNRGLHGHDPSVLSAWVCRVTRLLTWILHRKDPQHIKRYMRPLKFSCKELDLASLQRSWVFFAFIAQMETERVEMPGNFWKWTSLLLPPQVSYPFFYILCFSGLHYDELFQTSLSGSRITYSALFNLLVNLFFWVSYYGHIFISRNVIWIFLRAAMLFFIIFCLLKVSYSLLLFC